MEARMTTNPLVPDYTDAQIASFLGAARETIAAVRLCWLATRSLEGGTNARIVDSFSGAPGSDEWTRRFLVRRHSRKVPEMRAAPSVTLAYQHPSGDRCVALGGRATIIDDVVEMRTLWPTAMEPLLPPGFADANMIVIRVEVDRIELHARGLTAEPFGTGRTLLERQPGGSWRYIPITPPVGISAMA
jgi:general stress protein 26